MELIVSQKRVHKINYQLILYTGMISFLFSLVRVYSTSLLFTLPLFYLCFMCGYQAILSYTIGYLRYPKKITMKNPLDEYEDFPDVIMPEIIKMAAQMYIENKIPEQQRYQTIVNEVNTQE